MSLFLSPIACIWDKIANGVIYLGSTTSLQEAVAIITTYIGDYQDASEDISNLAGEVTTTFRHVEQLQKLIDSEQNTATKAFSDSGLLEAEACKLKARQLADRLWKLVKKSNATFPADGSLSADQLDISIFGKAKWPRFKPRVEQHKHELVVLNTNILICMVGYRLESGAPPADQVRATEELDRLKRSKKLALHSLREAQKRRKRKKVKSVDDRRPHFSDDERPPIRQGSGNSYATPLYPRRPSRAASYDDYYRDGDSWLPDEAFIDQLEEDLRKDILLQMEEDKVVKEMAERKAEEERVAAVAKYKEDLVKKLNQSSQTAEDLKRALVKTFPARVSENSVTRFVEEQRQADAVKDDEVAQLMPVREYADWRRAKRLRKRTRILDITTFSVIVSVDGDRHRASLVNVPTPWTDKLLAEQEKKGWWKGASFKETLHTYARLDLQSRNVAEDEADRQGVDSGQLVLLYARMLDKNISKGRKLLDAMMMASDPWEYFHGRALLIYKVSGGGQSHRNRHYDSNAREGRQKSEEQAAYRDEVDYRVEPDFERSHVQDRHSKRGPYKGSHTYVAPRYPIAPDALAPRVDEYAFRHVPSGYPEGHRPTYARVQRKYMSTETLAYYSIPYEVDRDDPDYFILLRDIDQLYRVEAKTEWEDDERHERNVGMEKVETEAEVEQMYPREWRTTKDEEADADAGRKLRQRDEPIRRRSAGPVYDERGRPIEIEEDRRERDDRHYAWDRERDPSITKSRDARYIIVERKDDERTLGYRPVSALSASRSSHLHTVGGRSRLRSRARAYDRRLEAQSVAEEGGDQQDSPSDLFESEMSEEDSGDEKAAGKRLVRAGKQRERGSGASSVLGLESTTESPSSLSDSQEVQPVPRITPSSRGSRGSYLFGYVRPYAETVTDYEPSRHNPAESARVPGRSLAEGDPSQVPEVRVIGHNETTDDEAVYQTAVESHGIDDYNEVVVGGPDEAVRDETTHGTGADQHGDAARHPEVFHDNEEPLARAADGPVIVEEVD
ncbi:hypothetical protein B0A55_11176 [Friedmanniomyces simplex]|uniref:Uncharacterized protein n=1 Tax=Friedmanniomyces simplex TaxID=329884 RepID=A0A4U0WJN4_9PEZI|nr:hypothetical protein B0A55_11176 [Friedmanniomyces simplex]